MDTDRQAIADQILQAIEYGNLPQHEIERRLNQILEEELTVPSNSDESLVSIDLCNSLLWQLSNHGECNYQDHLAERKEVVSQKYQFYKRRKALVSHWMKVTAAILVIVLGLSAASFIPRINWYTGNSTEDEQQYIIAGHEISVQQISMALAAQPDHFSLVTESEDEISELLGFPIYFPERLGVEYTAKKYYSSSSENQINIACTYVSDYSGNKHISLRMTLFPSIRDIYAHFKLEETGDDILTMGYRIYRSYNLQVVRYVWIKNNVLYELAFNPKETENQAILEQLLNEE